MILTLVFFVFDPTITRLVKADWNSILSKNSEGISKAIGALPGVEVKTVKDLSVLDLAPGSHPIRLTIYSKSAIEEIAKIKSTHLEVMVKTQ